MFPFLSYLERNIPLLGKFSKARAGTAAIGANCSPGTSTETKKQNPGGL
jgi:hypothetical protein